MIGFNRPFCSRLPANWRAQLDPRDPDYDDPRADRVCDEAVEGQLILEHAPCELLRALAEHCDERHADAVRELLRPLYNEKQSTFLKALHSEFSRSDAAKDIADLALQREYGES